MRKGQQATTDRIAQLQLIQQQKSYDLFVQQSLWYQMQMQMQTATPHVAYHTTTAQVLYTGPSTLYRVFENLSMSHRTDFVLCICSVHARLFLPLTLIALSL